MNTKNLPKLKKICQAILKTIQKQKLLTFLVPLLKKKTSVLSDIDIDILIDEQKIDFDAYRYGYKATVLTDLI